MVKGERHLTKLSTEVCLQGSFKVNEACNRLSKEQDRSSCDIKAIKAAAGLCGVPKLHCPDP